MVGRHQSKTSKRDHCCCSGTVVSFGWEQCSRWRKEKEGRLSIDALVSLYSLTQKCSYVRSHINTFVTDKKWCDGAGWNCSKPFFLCLHFPPALSPASQLKTQTCATNKHWHCLLPHFWRQWCSGHRTWQGLSQRGSQSSFYHICNIFLFFNLSVIPKIKS